jgi:hypothetical protein
MQLFQECDSILIGPHCKGRPEATSIAPEVGQSDPQPLHQAQRATIRRIRESFFARGRM